MVNSDPLSQNNTLGTPRFVRIWFRVPTTSSPFSLCPTSMARLSRVNTSRIVNARNRRPSANWSATKSRLHAWLGSVGRRRSRRCCTARAAFAEYVAASNLLLDRAGRPVFFPLPIPPDSAAPGSSGIRNEPEFEQSPGFAGAEQSSVPACSHSGRATPGYAPHGKHAARSPGRFRVSTPPPGGAARASQFFCQHVLQHRLVQRQLCDKALQPSILFLQLLALAHLIRFQPLVLPLPAIKGLLCDPHLADQLRHRYPHLRLFQHRHDLFHGKPFPLHGKSPFFR